MLDREKAARIEETETSRKGIRNFTDEVVKIIQSQYQHLDILDYTGGALCRREFNDPEGGILLVDTAHVLESNATLVGGRAYVSQPGRVQFCLVRPTADGRAEVTAISGELVAGAVGRQAWDFGLPMAAKKGDLIGLYMLDKPLVPFDKSDTERVAVFKASIKLGLTLKIEPPSGRGQRAYSFGAVGYLQ